MKRSYAIQYLLIALLLISVQAAHIIHIEPSSDEDGYKVWLASRCIRYSGDYQVSRFPGYPAFELLAACFSNYHIMNLILALVWAIGVVAVGEAARQMKANAFIAMALWAFIPTNYALAASLMDYSIGNFFLAIAVLASIRGKNAACGLFLGMAVATRLTNLPFALAISICPPVGKPFWRRPASQTAVFTTAFIIPICAFYSFPIIRYGLDFIRGYSREFGGIERIKWILYRGGQFLGFAATIAIAVFFVLRRIKFNSAVRFALVCSAFYAALFIAFPFEPAYLLPPAMAWAIALATQLNFKRAVAIVAILMIGGFIDVYPINPDLGTSLRISPMPGGYLMELHRRNEINNMRKTIRHFSAKIPYVFLLPREESLVRWTGEMKHTPWILDYEYMWTRNQGEYFAQFIDSAIVKKAIYEGYALYTFEKTWNILGDERIKKVRIIKENKENY